MNADNTRLHQVLPVMGQKHNRYCGPAALAALTGLNTGEAATLLREVSGKRAIMGTTKDAMIEALNRCGLFILDQEDYYPQKLMAFSKWQRWYYKGQRCLVIASNHYWAIDNYYYVDSYFRRPTHLSDIHMPKCQVHTVYNLYASA